MADESTPATPTPETPPPRTTGGNWRWEPPTAEELQKLMPGYTIEKPLGRGGMGAVYRGVQTNLDRPVAIKILPPGVEKEDPSFAERFKSEARLMARLSNPAVVAVYDFGTNLGGQLYFAMEYVDGSDVSQMIAAQGRLPPEHALAITAHVCDALGAAHELGIVHRDIKPANVLLNMKGQVKVADFGLAKIEDPGQHGLTKTGYAMGTPDFVAPEALTLGTAVDGRADLYAVGVMLYQMLTGNIPRGAFKPASVLVPGLDPRFDPIILKAMQHDRAERHQSAAELRRELDVILTVPFVRNDAPASAAIPVAQMAQAPGQRSAAQKPQPQSRPGVATARPAAGGSATDGRAKATPVLQSKSKTPLLIGLGAAAAIGIGAFVMFSGGRAVSPKPPPGAVGDSTPPAKPASVASATPKPASSLPTPKPAPSPVSSSPSLPISKSSEPQLPPGKWVKVLTKAEDLPVQFQKADSGARLKGGELEVDSTSTYLGLTLAAGNIKNCAVRATIVSDSFNFRMRDDPVGTDFYLFKPTSIEIGRRILKGSSPDFPRLATFAAPPKTEQSWELGAVGEMLVVRRSDKIIGIATDARIKSGPALLANFKGTIRDIEVMNLDGLSETEALKILGVDEKGNDLRKPAAVAATTPAPAVSKSPSLPVSQSSAKFPPGQWVKMFTKFEDLPEELRKQDSGVKFEDGWIRFGQKQRKLYLPGELGANCAVRARALVHGADMEIDRIVLRRTSEDGFYQLLGHPKLLVQQWTKGAFQTVWEAPITPLSPGSEYLIEFAAVGGRLVGRQNDTVFKMGNSAVFRAGEAYIYGSEDIRDIEVVNLNGLPEAEALRIIGIDEKGNDLRALAAKQMEQAKVVDAASAIPELKALHEQFVKLQAERVTSPFAAEVAKLNAGYVGGIDREIANEKKAGHLDGVLALEEEKKAVAGARTPSSAAVPIEDAGEGTRTPALQKLRGIYRAAYAKIEAARAENLKALTDPLTLRLKQLESSLTQKDRVADAKTVREYREGLGRSTDIPAREPSDDGIAAKTIEAGKSTGTEPKIPKPKNAFTEREAAEWVLSFAGKGAVSVTVLVPGKGEQQIQSLAQLPKEKFLVRKLTVSPSQVADRDLITDQQVQRLMRLEDVQFIDLGYGQLTGQALRALGQIPTLAELHFPGANLSAADLATLENAAYKQLHLNGLFLKDEAAMRVFGTMKNLRFLNLGGLIDAEMMAAMPVLPKLEIFTTTVNDRVRDDFLPLLPKKFPALQRIDLWEASKVQGDTLASLKELKDLIDLGINHTQVDDDKLSAIADMKRLQRLGIAGTKITDACIPTLKTLKSLHTLSIFQTQITDGGLLELADLRSLKNLNLRHADGPPIGPPSTGFTEAGVAAFQKKRPDVVVTK